MLNNVFNINLSVKGGAHHFIPYWKEEQIYNSRIHYKF